MGRENLWRKLPLGLNVPRRRRIVQFMEDLEIVTAVNHSSSFGKDFIKFKGKNKNIIHQPRSVRIEKKCARGLDTDLPAGE